MQEIYRMHNVKRPPIGPHAPWPNRVSLAACGHSSQESGPDHSGTEHSCPVDAQGGDSEKHLGDLEWNDAGGVGYATKTKRSLGPSFHESRAADIHTDQARFQKFRNRRWGLTLKFTNEKLRRPLDALWIWKNFQTRVSEQEHLFCGSLAKHKQMSGKCFHAILDRQRLMVTAPVDLRTKKAGSVTPQLLQGFFEKPKRKNRRSLRCPPTVATKSQKKVCGQQYHFVLGRGRTPNPWRKTHP